jgi:hypothetical protein
VAGAGAERPALELGLGGVLGDEVRLLELADVVPDALAGDAQLVGDGGLVLALVEALEDLPAPRGEPVGGRHRAPRPRHVKRPFTSV